MRFFISSAFASLAIAPFAHAQLVAGNDQTAGPTIWLIDVTGATPNQALVTGTNATTWGLTVNNAGQTLWWNNAGTLLKAPFGPAPLAPVAVGALNVGGSSANVTGMAFDTAAGKLYGYRSVTTPGFYEIDQNTAAMTLASATPASTDFGGFDYDPGTNAFYGLNDGTGLSGRGLYRITNITGAPTYTLLTPYPVGETDIDGLAVGNGRAYMVNDNSTAGQGIYVFNLSTLAFEPTIANPFSGTNGIFAGGGWAPGLIPEPSSLPILGGAMVAVLGRRKRV